MNYEKLYYRLILKRRFLPLKRLKKTDQNFVYVEEHHIIPLSLGGQNTSDNLIFLTAREHFIAHLLLVKIYQSTDNKSAYYKMCKAMTFFKCQSVDGKERIDILGSKITSRLFEKICLLGRVATSNSMKIYMNTHKPNNGRKWVTNEKENRYLKPEDVEKFLEKNPDWRYGQKFVHRTCTAQAKANRLVGMKKSKKYQSRFKKQ